MPKVGFIHYFLFKKFLKIIFKFTYFTSKKKYFLYDKSKILMEAYNKFGKSLIMHHRGHQPDDRRVVNAHARAAASA